VRGEAPQPPIPYGFSQEDIGKPLFYDYRKGRLVTETEQFTQGDPLVSITGDTRYASLYYDPYRNSITDQVTPVRMRVGMDPTNLDPALEEKAGLWAQEQEEITRMARFSLDQQQRNLEWYSRKQAREVEEMNEANRAYAELEAVNTRLAELTNKPILSGTTYTNEEMKEMELLRKARSELKEDIASSPVMLTFTGTGGIARNLELRSPQAQNFGYQLLWNLQRPVVWYKQEIIGKEEVSGFQGTQAASDVVYALARALTVGVKTFTAHMPFIGARSKEIHREMYRDWLKDNETWKRKPINETLENIWGYASTWFIARGHAIYAYLEDDFQRFEDGIRQGDASLEAFLDQIASNEPTIGGLHWMQDDLELDQYIHRLETGQADQGPRTEQMLKNARIEQDRRQRNIDLKARSEAQFQEVFEALEFADANQLDMEPEEYNEIYAKARLQVSEALELYTQRSDIPAYWFTYSKRLAADGAQRWQNYMDAMANFILTAHRMPQPWEWEQIGNQFTDPAAELIGELVFDPLNLIPGVVMDEILNISKALIRAGVSGAKYAGRGAVSIAKHVPKAGPVIESTAGWLGRLSVRSQATAARFMAIEPLQTIGKRSSTFDEILTGVEDAVNGVTDLSRGLDPRVSGLLNDLAKSFNWAPDEAVSKIQDIFRAGRQVAIDDRIAFIENSADELNEIRRLNLLADDAVVPSNLIRRRAENWANDWTNVKGFVGDVVEEAYLKQNRVARGLLDEGIIAWGVKNGMKPDNAAAIIKTWRWLMTGWKSAILTLRPGFTVINYLDSMFRSVMYGSNPLAKLDDVARGVFAKQMPEEILARFGGPELEGIGQIASAIMRGELSESLPQIFWAGFKESDSGINVLGRISNGARAMNAGFEFSLSARLWSHEFKKGWSIVNRLVQIEKANLRNSIDNVDDYVARLLDEMWNQSGDDAVETVLDRFLRGDGRFVVPQKMYDDLANLVGATDSQAYWNSVTRDINELIDNGLEGAELADNINRVLDNRMEGMVADYEDAMARMELVAEGGHASIFEGDPSAVLDLDQMDDATSARVGGLADDIIQEVEEATGVSAREFGLREDEEVFRRLEQELRAEGIDIKLTNNARQRSGVELVAARARFHDNIDDLRKSQQAVAERLEFLTQQADPASTELVAQLAATNTKLSLQLNHLEDFSSMMEQLYSGPLRNFMIEVFPGPMNPHLADIHSLRGSRWNAYDNIRGRIFEKSAQMFDSRFADVMADNITDLHLMPTIDETLQGWGMQIEYSPAGDAVVMRLGETNPHTGRFIITDTLEDRAVMGEKGLAGALGYNPNVHGSFQDFMQQPFTRPLIQGQPFPAGVPATSAWPHPGMQGWWDDLMFESEGMLGHLLVRYGDVMDDTGQPVLRNYNALKQHMLAEARLADDMGRPAAAAAIRYRHRALVDEYNAAYRMMDGSAAPLMPGAGIPNDIPAGMSQWIQTANAGEQKLAVIGNLNESLKADIAGRMDNGTWEFVGLVPEQEQALREGAAELARLQQEGITAVNYGGEFLGHDFGEGAVGLVNKVMIDYAHETQAERLIKKFYPFWKFPSKSLPFWAETMVKNPELAAFYAKYMQTSRRQAYNNGAVNSKGEQLSRMTGYLPMPGNPDKWFNPLSPLSFRFIFPRPNPRYSEEEDDMPFGQQVFDWIYEYGSAYGFSPSPLASAALYGTGLVDPNVHPRWSLLPQPGLIPPFAQRWIGQNLRKFGMSRVPDLWQPELPWLDSLIEKRVLVNILEEMSNPNLTQMQKEALALEAERTIQFRDKAVPGAEGLPEFSDPLAADRWLDARAQVENTEWTSRFGGYFTGFYPKEFSQAEADLLELRDQINSMKFALNNEAAALVIDVPANTRRRWDLYLEERYNTPEGWVADLYGARRWVQDEVGQQLRGQDRWDAIGQNIATAQETRARYEALRQIREELQAGEDLYDVGAPWEEKEHLYQRYIEARAKIEASQNFAVADREWFIGWKPKRLVWEDLRNLYWNTIEHTKPRYAEGMDYGVYLEAVDEWTKYIQPMSSIAALEFWNEFNAIEWMDPTMNSIEDITDRLAEESTAENYRQWLLDKDTPLDALARAWTEKYWQTHWEAVGGASGLDFQIAQQEFYNGIAALNGDNPPMNGDVGPSQELLFRWVGEIYGERFSPADLIEALGDKDILTAEERMNRRRAVEIGPDLAAMEERMWTAYNKIPPGHSDELIDEYMRLGGVYGEAVLDMWRNSNGASAFRDQDEFEESLKIMEQAVKNLDWGEPPLEELRLRQEARELNDQFRAFIEENLGEGFWDQRSYYFRLSGSEKDEYRQDNPSFAADMDFYDEVRDSFAEQFPLWAAYYTNASAQTGSASARGVGESGRARASASGGSRGGLAPIPDPGIPGPGLRSGTTAEDVLRGRLGRGGTTQGFKWPDHVREMLGGTAVNELTDSASNNVKWIDIDDALKNLIQNIDENHEGVDLEDDVRNIYEEIRRGGGGKVLAL
jgi:hypothetical protein